MNVTLTRHLFYYSKMKEDIIQLILTKNKNQLLTLINTVDITMGNVQNTEDSTLKMVYRGKCICLNRIDFYKHQYYENLYIFLDYINDIRLKHFGNSKSTVIL